MTIYHLLFLLATYLIAAIPFGVILAKVFAGVDVRKAGSKNIGATNVTRLVGKKLGIITFILDAAKGAVMVVIARCCFSQGIETEAFVPLVALIAVLGHVYPIYLNFKGGKGVATSVAVLFAINPVVGLIVVLVWVAVFYIFKISSLASLSAISSTLFIAYFCDAVNYPQAMLFLSLFVIVTLRYKENIIRLLEGKEKVLVNNKGKNEVKKAKKEVAKLKKPVKKPAKKVAAKSVKTTSNAKRKNVAKRKNPTKR